jgi:hypothetical protein
MAITYVATPLVRPSGVSKYPLIPAFRNPQNDNTKNNYVKDGPTSILKIGPSDYRAWREGVTDLPSGNMSRFFYATSTDGFAYTNDPATAALGALDPLAGPNWENGEACPSEWLYDPIAGQHLIYYHGGNNGGQRQIGLMTSPTGLPGTLTRYGAVPVLANGGAGAWDEKGVADARVVRLAANDWRMLYKGFRLSDGKSQIGLATSTDGRAWTKSPANPVLPLGVGNEAGSLNGGWCDIDELGRVHFWYPGVDVGLTQRILYAFSDAADWTVWTRDATDVMLVKSATASDPDAGEIGDVIHGTLDDGLILFTLMNFNLAGYTGDALGRLEGRGIYWLPRKAATQPARSARVNRVHGDANRQYMTVPAGASLMQQTVFSIYCEFRCPPGGSSRPFYVESANFNILINFGLDVDGTFGNASGRSMCRYRTPTNTVTFASATRYDDNKWHRACLRRIASGSWQLIVDGAVIQTSVVDPGTDATALAFFTLMNPHPTDSGNYALVGYPATGFPGVNTGWGGVMLRRVVTIAGYAMTLAETEAIWNGGNAGGLAPASGTKKLDLFPGSGGQAGPDIDTSANAFSLAVTGPVMVNAAQTLTAITGGGYVLARYAVQNDHYAGLYRSSGSKPIFFLVGKQWWKWNASKGPTSPTPTSPSGASSRSRTGRTPSIARSSPS